MSKIKTDMPESSQHYIVGQYQERVTQAELAREHNCSIRQIRNILFNNGLCSHPEGRHNSEVHFDNVDESIENVMKVSKVNPKEQSKENVLIIPDLHAPFIRDGYLEFCKKMKKKWGTTQTYFLGDLLDNHYMSFHDSDPDGFSASEELDKAISQLKEFHQAFPQAKVTLGNHDSIPNRKAFNAGISNAWVKTVEEVLDFYGWQYNDVFWHNSIMICHGLGRKASARMKQDMVSVIQGHYHSESYIKYQVGTDRKTFAMQLGCGFDNNSYAAAYSRWFSRQHINVGILVEGKLPIIEYMEL